MSQYMTKQFHAVQYLHECTLTAASFRDNSVTLFGQNKYSLFYKITVFPFEADLILIFLPILG